MKKIAYNLKFKFLIIKELINPLIPKIYMSGIMYRKYFPVIRVVLYDLINNIAYKKERRSNNTTSQSYISNVYCLSLLSLIIRHQFRYFSVHSRYDQ